MIESRKEWFSTSKKYISFSDRDQVRTIFTNTNWLDFLERIKFDNSSIYMTLYIFNLDFLIIKKKKRKKLLENEAFLKWKIFLFYIFSDVKSAPSTIPSIVAGYLAYKSPRLASFRSLTISLRTRASILHFPEKMRRPKGDTGFDPTVVESMDSINHLR